VGKLIDNLVFELYDLPKKDKKLFKITKHQEMSMLHNPKITHSLFVFNGFRELLGGLPSRTN
jgi:hypothetical protein